MDASEKPYLPDRPGVDFSFFAWFLALAVVFQLARGDMGVFPGFRNTPNGYTLGDGVVPLVWFCCALLTLAFPTRVWSVVLLAMTGLYDFWWRLPVATPSIYFHALVSAQIAFTAAYLVVRQRTLHLSSAAFIDALRKPILGLLVGLFFFGAFHKLTGSAIAATSDFFALVSRYYVPFLPMWRVPDVMCWLVTIGGEGAIACTLLFKRTRWVGVLLCIGFTAFVGSTVYGFGAIILAAVMPLVAVPLLLEPLDRLNRADSLSRIAKGATWRIVFAILIGGLFIIDHARGFSLADRPWLFGPAARPTIGNALTILQVVWFVLNTTVLACVLMAVYRHRSRIVAHISPARAGISYALPLFLACSELALYAGWKNTPAFTMFSGVTVESCAPNHWIARSHFLNSFFYRDLLLVTAPGGERIGIPALSLKEKWRRSRRLGVVDSDVEAYRDGEIGRLHAGVESRFSFNELEHLRATSWVEVLLPRRLFFLNSVSEANLRCSMPDLFSATPGARSSLKP